MNDEGAEMQIKSKRKIHDAMKTGFLVMALNRTWTGHGAIDTGKLPDASGGASASSRIVSASTDIPIVEIGGVRSRRLWENKG
jgi:hypothetical protein